MDLTTDAVVIGAGVIGSSIALELSRDGWDVVVLDKAGGVGHGSTSASSAVVRFNYSTWSGVAAAWESMHAWCDWAGHLGGGQTEGLAVYERTGMLLVHAGPTDTSRTTALFDRASIPWETWDADVMAVRLPHVDPGAYWPPKRVDSDAFFDDSRGTISGIFTPDGGHVNDPQLAAQNLADAATRHGARFLLNREVVTVTQDQTQRWRIETANGDVVDAGVVVNAAGPWSGRLNVLAGVGDEFTVTTRPLRQEVHYVAAPPGYAGHAIAMADLDLGIYTRRAEGGGILVGGTEPACDPLEWLDSPEEATMAPTVGTFQAQVTRAARRMPDLGVPSQPRGVAGVYDASSDWTPIYDRTDRPGFYVAMGTSGNQFKNAPVVGQMMRALISSVEKGHDHDRVPVSFTAPRTGNVIDLGEFSRLRPFRKDAPTSVMG